MLKGVLLFIWVVEFIGYFGFIFMIFIMGVYIVLLIVDKLVFVLVFLVCYLVNDKVLFGI